MQRNKSYDVLAWVAQSADKQGWDGSSIGISGSSAGAKLALSALLLAYPAGPVVKAAALIVPPVDMTPPVEEYVSVLPKPLINQKVVRLIQDTYFVDAARRAEYLASPILDPNLGQKLPPTVVIGAEQDTLTPGVERLVNRMRSDKLQVAYYRAAGVDHDFLILDSTPARLVTDSLTLITDHLSTYLGHQQNIDDAKSIPL